jgi:hypothetical protein
MNFLDATCERTPWGDLTILAFEEAKLLGIENQRDWDKWLYGALLEKHKMTLEDLGEMREYGFTINDLLLCAQAARDGYTWCDLLKLGQQADGFAEAILNYNEKSWNSAHGEIYKQLSTEEQLEDVRIAKAKDWKKWDAKQNKQPNIHNRRRLSIKKPPITKPRRGKPLKQAWKEDAKAVADATADATAVAEAEPSLYTERNGRTGREIFTGSRGWLNACSLWIASGGDDN